MSTTTVAPKPATDRSPASAGPGARHAQRNGTAGQPGLFAQMLRGQAEGESGPGPATPSASAAKDTPEAQGQGKDQPGTPREDARSPADATPPPPQAATPTPVTQPPESTGGPGRGGDSADGDALAALRDALGGGAAAATARKQAGALRELRGGREAADTGREAGEAGRSDGSFAAARDAALAAVTERQPLPAAAPVAAAAEGALPSLGAVTEALQAASGASSPVLAAPSDSPASAPPPQAQASLSAEPGTAAFAPALGLQLSTWLREGVQHARLELHPQELGPIDVRIAVHEGKTQVDLAADVLSTRQALSEALPQLSAALGDVGLQLSGGGVSDQDASRRQAAGQGAEAFAGRAGPAPGRTLAGTAGGEAEPAGGPARVTRHRGLLDLYA